MLSNVIIRNNLIYTVCEKSGRILRGDRFRGVYVPEMRGIDRIPSDAVIVCCGDVNAEEILFRTQDGRFYFSLCDGWGENGGVLYGLRGGIFFDFKHPTTEKTILAECDACGKGTYSTFGGAMAFMVRMAAIDTIRSVMKRV